MSWLVRDERGWKVKTRFLTFHPVSYGTATLARLSIGLHPEGRRVMLHYFPPNDHWPVHFHDHPFDFITFVLWGAYDDESVIRLPGGGDFSATVIDHLQRGSVRYRPATHRHRTFVRRRTVTLVLRSATKRNWCEGTAADWKCEGDPADFAETLGMAVHPDASLHPGVILVNQQRLSNEELEVIKARFLREHGA